MASTTVEMTPTLVSEEEASLLAMQLASASVLPMILKTLLELDLLEIMARAGPGAFLSPSDIASKLQTKNPEAAFVLDRMLRLLASYSVVTYSLRTLPDATVQRLYGLGPVCKFLTKNEDGVSIAPLCLMNQDKVLMESWYYLKESVLEGGIPFNKAHGLTSFEHHGKDPRFNKVFNKGMADHSTITMKKILETYKGFEGLTSVVDVGGGTGAVLSMILSKYPSIRGINFDLPHVIQDSPIFAWYTFFFTNSHNKFYNRLFNDTRIEFDTDGSWVSGVEHVGGDMFVSIPKGDAIFMKWICHDWSDEHCLKILKNCYEALPENGKVIVAECVLPVELDTSLATKGVVHIDVIMLAHNPGGKERTEQEFQSFRVMCSAFNTYIMEFLKVA